jgi:hypothetical protein
MNDRIRLVRLYDGHHLRPFGDFALYEFSVPVLG